MSMEKNRQREEELLDEIERLQNDIREIQKSSEEGASVSHKLSKEVTNRIWSAEQTLHFHVSLGERGRGSDHCAEGRGGEADPRDARGQHGVARHLAAGGVQAVPRR